MIKPRFKVGQSVELPYGSPAMGGGYIPSESVATVVEACEMRGGEMPRYRVRWAGLDAWAYESALQEASR